MPNQRVHGAFVGTWQLDPDSCQYEQGEPPRSGSYRIEEQQGQLVFTMDWIDSQGDDHHASFAGPPDGSRVPFAGGDLADAFSLEAVSERELNSTAFFRGERRMVAQRQLDVTKSAMRITQVIFLPDGSRAANVSIYRKLIVN